METSPNLSDSTEESSSSVFVQTDSSFSSNVNANGDSREPETGGDSAHANSKSNDALAKGLSSMLTTVIRDFDSRAQHTLKSQDQLCSAIDRLTRELDQLLEDAPLPFIMQHAAKISGVRKRVSSLNSLLTSIQRRVDNIDRMLSVGTQNVCSTHAGAADASRKEELENWKI